MADRQVQFELAKIKLELTGFAFLVQSSMTKVEELTEELTKLEDLKVELEREETRLMVGNPKKQARLESIQSEITKIVSKPAIIGPIFHLYADVLINIIPNILEKIDGNTTDEERALIEKMKNNIKDTLEQA